MLDIYIVIALTFFINALPVGAAEFCQYDYSSSRSYRYYSRYCDYGCCDSKYSSYSNVCCSQNIPGIIAGAVIGSLVGLAILIGIIVYCCVKANNSKRRTGIVMQTANTAATQTFVVSNTTVTQGPSTNPGPYGYGYPGGFPPPSYAQYSNVPQGGVDPVYPPPPPAKY